MVEYSAVIEHATVVDHEKKTRITLSSRLCCQKKIIHCALKLTIRNSFIFCRRKHVRVAKALSFNFFYRRKHARVAKALSFKSFR